MDEEIIDKDLREIMERELERTKRELVKRGVYPATNPITDHAWVNVVCVSDYFDKTRQWFINTPKDGETWELMERYTILKHALECVFHDCPSIAKAIDFIDG